jgi:hypothetical protein
MSEDERTNPDDLIALTPEQIADGFIVTVAPNKVNKYVWYAQKAYKFCMNMTRENAKYHLFRTAVYEEGHYGEWGYEIGISGNHPVFDLSVTGLMLNAHLNFYELTGDGDYLDYALEDALAAHDWFKVAYEFGGETYYRYIIENDWINQTYIWGLYDLSQYKYEETKYLFDEFQRTMDYAYENTLVNNYISPYYLTGWFDRDERCDHMVLLDASGNASMYTFIALWEKGIYNNDVKPITVY